MPNPQRIRLGVVAVPAAAFVLALTSCGAPTGEASGDGGSSDGPIRLGLIAPLTGVAAADGTLMEQGAELAVKELNADGGVDGRTVELVTEDVKDLKSDAVASAVTRLTTDSSVAAAFTGYASTTNFEIDLFAEANLPYLLAGGSDQTKAIIEKDPEKYAGIWSLTPSYGAYETDLPERLATWDADGTLPLRNKSVYIVSSDNPYSNGIADGLVENFTADGWDVTGPDTVPFGEVNDWTPQIAKIRSADPSVVVNLDYQTSNAVRFVTQFRDNPTNSLLFSQYAPSVPEFVELAGADADGVVYNNLSGVVRSSAYEPAAEFLEKFDAEYQADPGSYGAMVYEEIMVWAAAAEAAGDPFDKDAVAEALAETNLTETAIGSIQFDPETHLAETGDTDGVPLQFYQLQEGKPVLLGPEEYADGEFQRPSWMTSS